MSLHRLASVTMGVPDPAAVGDYYRDFGLTETSPGRFATTDGGEQLTIVRAPARRLNALRIEVDDPDDLGRAARSLRDMEIPVDHHDEDRLEAVERVTGLRVTLKVAPRREVAPAPAPLYNGPGRIDRPDVRAAAVERTERVRPRKLGHVVIGSPDEDASRRFFSDGLGLKLSDRVPGLASFLRCSVDHHNVLVQAAPTTFLHHTAWEVDDVDEVGRGATAMLEQDPGRHVWGLGRHHIGSNFFWYLKDPAGNFSEYYSDLDEIVQDQLWSPETIEGARGLYNWGPPPPPSFLKPEDLAAHMAGTHST
ncbi:VOC family protein [Pseudonocardia kujensis]|uniref:VOC family protein n=1 Tax=Pseudonocardia kujensis TaxID=1128675 RepID=UPI001E3AEB8C|nr:VOC family protein [Pseudonocardia kujensis]MCE0765062.1 VOC family protein [Pseudonocardia kujensis]